MCNARNVHCFNKAEDELTLREFDQGIASSGENFRGKTTCNCLPSCTSIAYEAEISQADYEYVHSGKRGNSTEAEENSQE